MRRILILLTFTLWPGVSAAQVTYQVTTLPTFVITTGRAEAVGAARITATSPTGTLTVAGSILFSFNFPCDNIPGSGMSLATDGTAFIDPTTVNIASITNSFSGCIVAVNVNGGIAVTNNSSFIELRGVRGRIDLLGGIGNVGQNITVFLGASPANSALFTVPNQGVVGITAVGLQFVSATPATAITCLGTVANPGLTFREGFNGAFVQNVTSTAGTTLPVNARPLAGGTNNTQVRIIVTGLPSGMTLTWPATVNSSLGFVAATTVNGGSRLERLTSATSTVQTYEYVCADQSQCDVNSETFSFTGANAPVVGLTSGASASGTATLQIRLFPDLIPGEATFFTSSFFSAPRPRFNDPLIPSPAATFFITTVCTLAGVVGEGGGVGVDGLGSGGSGIGVLGEASASSGSTIGVKGLVQSGLGTAAVFDNSVGGNLITGAVSGVNKFRVDGGGNVFVTAQVTGGADFAESMAVRGPRREYEPGDLLAVDQGSPRHVTLTSEPYSRMVAGIYATRPGILASPYNMDDLRLGHEIPVAVVGIVPCKVSAENGPIEIGDLLVTSATPGHAMKGTDRSRMLGAIVGKALEPLREGKGVIQVLVTVQ